MKQKIICLFALVFVLSAAPVYAAEIITATKENPNVVVGAKETHKNLYVAAGQVTVNSETKGDLTAAGGVVSVIGNVEQDALIAGGNVDVSGIIGSTLRIAGGNILVGGNITEDLVVVGGNITVSSKAQVGGDVLVAAGSAVINAPVLGNIKIAGGSVTINSKVSGSVEVLASEQLIFGPDAVVEGVITYKGQRAAIVDPAAKISEIKFNQIEARNMKPEFYGLMTLGFLIKLLAWLIAAWVIVHFKKNFVEKLNSEIILKPWENLGIGFLTLVTTPIAIVILLFTFVGYYLAFLLGVSYVLILGITGLMASIALGYFVLAKIKKTTEGLIDWQAILIGVVLWMLLGFIPLIGWLAMTIIFLMTLGAGIKLLKQGLV
jgi:carbonic anhydrase/acetyltransferase-like protein (isoleucine patch superfamily)